MAYTFTDHMGVVHDITAIEASIVALINRGVNHVLGNEVASQVTAWKRAECGLKADDKSPEAKAAIAKFTAENKEAIEAKTREYRDAKVADILAGKLGVRTGGGGGAVDPLTREMNRIATAELQVLLEAHGLKLPRGEDTLSMRGKDLTRGDLIAAHLAKHGDKVEKEAKANLAAAARKAKALVADAGDSLADALGIG